MLRVFASRGQAHHPKLRAAACLLAIAAAVAAPLGARAATTWDAASCGALTVGAGAQGGPPGNRHAVDWHAALQPPGGGSPGRLAAHVLASDGPADLDGLPTLIAGAMLVALDPDRPRGCDLQHAFREVAVSIGALPAGASARERWVGLEARSGGNDLDVGALRLRAVHGQGGITTVEADGSGLTGAGSGVASTPPSTATVRVSAPSDRVAAVARGGALRLDDTLRIEMLRLAGGDALIEATGIVHPANRSGHLDVRARDMEGLRDALPAGDRMRAGAAFLILRLAARTDPDGFLAWNVDWEDREVTVNGVPLPLRP